jgi:hypothetical protein
MWSEWNWASSSYEKVPGGAGVARVLTKLDGVWQTGGRSLLEVGGQAERQGQTTTAPPAEAAGVKGEQEAETGSEAHRAGNLDLGALDLLQNELNESLDLEGQLVFLHSIRDVKGHGAWEKDEWLNKMEEFLSKKVVRDQPCTCMEEFSWQGQNYSNCSETPDYDGPWCYVVGGIKCPWAKDSVIPTEKKKWTPCQKSDANMTEQEQVQWLLDAHNGDGCKDPSSRLHTLGNWKDLVDGSEDKLFPRNLTSVGEGQCGDVASGQTEDCSKFTGNWTRISNNWQRTVAKLQKVGKEGDTNSKNFADLVKTTMAK